MIFGTTGFKLSLGSTVLFDNRKWSIKDLSKIESEYEIFIADDGSRNYTVFGQRWYPVLKFVQITAAEWDKLKSLLNTTVDFMPFQDNTAFHFPCKVVSVTPIWEDGKYWKNTAQLELKSIGYPEIITKATQWI